MTAALAPATEPTTRDVILDAAERHFAERGFDGVSMREIAADAGLRNQASLYHYFEHKQALYEAVLQRGVGLLIDVVADTRDSGSLTSYLDRVLDYIVDHPHLAVLMQRVSLDESEAARAIVSRVVRPLFGEGVRLLGDARDWAPEDLPHLAAGLYHLIFGYFADAALLRTVMRDDPMSTRAIARQRRFVHAAVQRLLRTDEREGA
jgi:AcrR family transcriptional regulator